jgi:hypothetical protein
MKREDFVKVAEETLDSLPEEFRIRIQNVAILVEDLTGDWRVSIGGSRANENWDMTVKGPNGFERSYTLSGAAGQHGPEAIRKIILQLIAT